MLVMPLWEFLASGGKLETILPVSAKWSCRGELWLVAMGGVVNKKAVGSEALPDGWRKVRLGEVCSFRSGSGFPEIYQGEKTGDYPFIKVSDMNLPKNAKYICQSNNWVTSEVKTRLSASHCPANSTVFAKVGAALKLNRRRMLTRDTIIDNNMMGAIPDTSEILPLFLYYYLMTKDFGRLCQESAVPSVNQTILGNLSLKFPPMEEQKAIASLLETWDTAIEKTEALIAAKEKRFKWLVEFLISKHQYSDTWNEHTLGNLFEFYTCPSKSKQIDETGKQFIIDMGSISRNGDLITTKRTHSTEDFLSINDLVMPKDDIGGGNIIGKVVIIESPKKYVCGDHVYRMVPKQGVNAPFLRFVINCPPINKELRACANGTAQLGLGKRDVAKQKVWLPPLDRQEKICDILNTAKSENVILRQLAENYRAEKRGLMQKLLTGKWQTE